MSDRAEPTMTDVLTAVLQLHTAMTGQGSELAGLRTDLTGLRTDLTGLRTEFNGLRTEFNGFSSEIRKNIVDLRAEITEVRASVMARIDRLQNEVTNIRDDISVNFGRSDKAEQVADNTRGEVRALSTIVSGMHRQIARLQDSVRELRDGNSPPLL